MRDMTHIVKCLLPPVRLSKEMVHVLFRSEDVRNKNGFVDPECAVCTWVHGPVEKECFLRVDEWSCK
jgi:hypothetical protein